MEPGSLANWILTGLYALGAISHRSVERGNSVLWEGSRSSSVTPVVMKHTVERTVGERTE